MCYGVVGIEIRAQTGSKQLGFEGGTMLNPPRGAGCLSRMRWMGMTLGMTLPAAE